MTYVRESGASMARRRRRRRAVITLSVVAVVLLGTFVYAAAYVQGWVGNKEPKPAPTVGCAANAKGTAALAPRSVTLNVYNATNRTGLAARVSSALRTQGFTIATVSNDPLTRTVLGTGEVRHGRSGLPAARLVISRLTTARLVQDGRTDGTVDLVLGERFSALSRPALVKPAPKPVATKPAAARTTPAC